MGVAAGSGVYQVIKKEPFSSATWSKARATILSIQILNSVALEALTGTLAPPSPITPQMYKKQGLPFLASYGEGVVTNGGYNLVGAKSVGELDAVGGNIQLGSSLSSSTKVGCTCCGRMLCDLMCVFPASFHPTFRLLNTSIDANRLIQSPPCITPDMTYGNSVFCRICNMRASNLLGFSAPIALPGEDRADFSDIKVITTQPPKGVLGFHSMNDLAIRHRLKSLLTYARGGQHQGTYTQQTVYELSG